MQTTFAHHDKIASVKSGSVLMIAEPVKAQILNGPRSGMHTLPAGTYLRVKFQAGGMWCECAMDGKVETVVVDDRDFTSLEQQVSP